MRCYKSSTRTAAHCSYSFLASIFHRIASGRWVQSLQVHVTYERTYTGSGLVCVEFQIFVLCVANEKWLPKFKYSLQAHAVRSWIFAVHMYAECRIQYAGTITAYMICGIVCKSRRISILKNKIRTYFWEDSPLPGNWMRWIHGNYFHYI